MIAVIVGAAAVTALVLTAAYLLVPTFGQHPGTRARPRRRRVLRLAWLRLLADVTDAALACVNGLRRDKLSDEDAATELWVDGLAVRRELGPPAPARRPQVLTVAYVRTAAIIRALPLESVPWLKHGQGYSDSTGTFKAITKEADQ